MTTKTAAALIAGLFVATMALSATRANAQEAFDPNALPHDEQTLQALSEAQLLLLNKAVRYCSDFGHSRHAGNFCVTSAIDLDVRQSDNEALKALHWSMAPMDRYDDKRSMVALQRFIKG